MPATATLRIRLRDMRWFREIAMRVDDLIDALDREDLSSEAESKLRALRAAFRVSRPEDDLPES